MSPITAVDLFCGAGGTSTGLIQAAAIEHFKSKVITNRRPVVQHGMPTRQVPVAYVDFMADYIVAHPEWFSEYCDERGVSGPVAMSILAGLQRGAS